MDSYYRSKAKVQITNGASNWDLWAGEGEGIKTPVYSLAKDPTQCHDTGYGDLGYVRQMLLLGHVKDSELTEQGRTLLESIGRR